MDALILRVIEYRAESSCYVVHPHAAVRAEGPHFCEGAPVAAASNVTHRRVGRTLGTDAQAFADPDDGFPFVTNSKTAQYVPEAHLLPLLDGLK